MKTVIITLFLCISLFSQQFIVEKVSGNVDVMRGTSEKWENIQTGMILSGDDIITTDPNAFIQLNNNGALFILKGNSALGLNYVKQVSINDLLLALAMEEIRNIPQEKQKSDISNTAVYGKEIDDNETIKAQNSNLGVKRLNGAKQLAEYGYTESAIIAARETYRKYPETRSMFSERLFFADLLMELELFEEAASEYQKLNTPGLSPSDTTALYNRMELLKKAATKY